MGAAARAAGDAGLSACGRHRAGAPAAGRAPRVPPPDGRGRDGQQRLTGGDVYRDGEPVVPKRRGVGGLVEHGDGVVSSLSFSGTDVLITTIGTLFRGRSEVAGVPVAPAAI
jgi:hypothetical protein